MEQKMMTCEAKAVKKTLLVDTEVLAVTSASVMCLQLFITTVLYHHNCDNRLILQHQACKHYVTQKPD